MDEDAKLNIYDDLPDFRYDRTLDQLNACIAKLETENLELQSKMVRLISDKKALEKDHNVLNTHFSSLMKTARLEIQRKDRTIAELREQLNKLIPQKKRFGLKRRGETAVMPSPKKKAKMSPRKLREDKRPPHETKSKSKPGVGVSDSNDAVSNRVATPPHVEKELRDRLASGAEKQSKDSAVTGERLSSGNCAGPSGKMMEPCPAVAAPVLPALECPTLFSSRMYKKLYGMNSPTVAAGVLAPPKDTIQPAVTDKPPPKLLKNDRPSSLSAKSSKHPSLYLSNRVSFCDAKTSASKFFLGDSCSSSSDRSNSPLGLGSRISRCVEPQNRNDGGSSKVAQTFFSTEISSHGQPPAVKSEILISQSRAVELHKHGGPSPNGLNIPVSQSESAGPKKLEAPVAQRRPVELSIREHDADEPGVPSSTPGAIELHSHDETAPEKLVEPHSQPRAVESDKHDEPSLEKSKVPLSQSPCVEHNKDEPSPIISLPADKTQGISSARDSEEPKAKSPIAKVGLLAVGRSRQQTVAAIRPLQTSAVRKTTAANGKSCDNHLVAQESTENSPRVTETNPSIRSTAQPNHPSKIPRLPGCARGRAGRRVFAPISHPWNHPQANVGTKDDSGKVAREFSVVKTVSVTSELTVRVDDLKPDELNTQFLFGSPVKWADDSLDSPQAEKPTNSRKMYSFFGSPCIDRSSSSEHQFTVSPGAYEDSCCTAQIPEKVPTEPPAVEADVQKVKRSEPLLETKQTVKTDDAEKAISTSSTFPPPSSVIKKHVSIFSPLKDSKHSLTNRVPDEHSRSNTGICFPFPRYEDSVLGQFDDTAQFVSALAKVDTKISPLSTPVKSGNDSGDAVETPTSFQQVFKTNLSGESLQNSEPVNVGVAEGVIATASNQSLSKGSSNEHPSGSSAGSGENNRRDEAGREKADVKTANSEPPKTVEPPAITVTPPKTGTSQRLIYRPNFASSTILSVKSWFPNAPVKMVTPRKTPRVVSNANRSSSPKGLDNSAGARIAINDAFIIEQEERVRRWEQYDSTARIGNCSPLKSPTRKRIESPGKNSPSKRPTKKRTSPSKVHRPARVESPVATGKESAGELIQSVPDCDNANAVATPKAVIFCQTSTEPVKSSPDVTQKLLTMINGLMGKTKRTDPRVESSPAEATKPEAKIAPMSADSKTVSVESRIENEASAHSKPNDLGGRASPRSTLEHDLPSQAAALETVESNPNAVQEEDLCPRKATNFSDPAVSPKSPSPCTLVLANDKSTPSPGEPSPGSKDVPEPNRSSSAEALPPGSSNVTAAGTPKSFSDRGRPSETNDKEKKQNETVPSPNAIASVPISSKSSDCSPVSPHGSDHSEPNREPIGRGACSKYATILSRVKPSTPLNKAVAALVTKSNDPASSPSPRPRLTVSAPAPSTKNSNFKRSSALKPNAGNSAGKLRDSITSTFYRGTPTCSAKANSSSARMTPKANIHPSRTRTKSTSSLSSNSSSEVNPSAPISNVLSRNNDQLRRTTAESAVSDRAARSKLDVKQSPRRWKLIEVYRPNKPVSLLQRFKELKYSVAAQQNPQTSIVAKPDGLNGENGGSAKHPVGQVFPKSSLRKTILLDSPIKMPTPTKRKRPAEGSVESPKSDVETKDDDASRICQDEIARVSSDEGSAKGTKKRCCTESGRSGHECTAACDGLSSKSRRTQRDASPIPRQRRRSQSDYRSPERSPSGACRVMKPSSDENKGPKSNVPSGVSSRKSRRTERDESPTRQRRKSRSAQHRSFEGSPARGFVSEIASRKSKRTGRDKSPTRQRSKSQSAYDRSPEGSPARVSRRMMPSHYCGEEKSSRLAESSSRKSRRTERDESPTSRLRRKSRSAHHRSPEGSVGSDRPIDRSESSARKSRPTERDESPCQRSKSHSTYRRSPERSSSRTSQANIPSDNRSVSPQSSPNPSRGLGSSKPGSGSIVITAQAPTLEKAISVEPTPKTPKPFPLGRRPVKLGGASFMNL